MKKILERILKEYNKKESTGLCVALINANISAEGMEDFLNYLEKNIPYFRLYYKYARNKRGESYYARTFNKNGAYYWHPDDRQSRIDWLNKHIKLNS